MYSPVLNRFTSRDPLPLEGEPDILYGESWVKRNVTMRMNPYAYVENNPANRIDPSGLQSVGFMDDLYYEFCSYAPPKASPKKGCNTVTSKDSIRRDKDGKVIGCKQDVVGVKLIPVIDALREPGTGLKLVDTCKGCIDVEDACKNKGKTHECFLDKNIDKKLGTNIHACRCLND